MKKIKKPIVIAGIIIGLAVMWFAYGKFFKSVSLDLIEVGRGDIIEEVLVTGNTKPVDSVDLAFEKSGKIISVYAGVGDKAVDGQNLVALDSSELQAQLRQAEAGAESQQAKLDQLKRGSRPEDIIIATTKVNNAQVDLIQSQKTVIDKIQDAYTKSDDAIYNQTDGLLNNPRTYPQLAVSINDFQLKTDIEVNRFAIEKILVSWKSNIQNGIETDKINENAGEAKNNLSAVRSYLDKMALAINSLSNSSSLSQTILDGYKTNISTARTNVSTAITNLSTAETALKSSQADLLLLQRQYDLTKAGSTPEDISSQQALVDEALANVDLIRAQLAKTVLRSPINGVVTKQEAKVGQIAAAGTALTSVISLSKLQIETNVPEVDIGRISINDPVRITLDAFPGENFMGKVIYTDPAETIIDGVVNFKVKIALSNEDARLKSGLTANLYIQTKSRLGVLTLPQYAILENDRGKFVKMVSGSSTKEVPVILGIRSQDGMVEIISGISEGNKVLNIGTKTKGN